MAGRRSVFLLALPFLVIGLLMLPGGRATAGPAVPEGAASATPGLCPSGIQFGVLVVTPSGPVVTESGSSPPITYGDPIAYGGQLDGDEGTPLEGLDVDIHRDDLDATQHTLRVQTDSDGTFGDFDQPSESRRYYATYTGTPEQCDGTFWHSGTVIMGVRVSITNSSSDYTPNAGQTFLIRGGVAPNHPGKHVTIQWHRVGTGGEISSATVTLDSLSHYSKKFHSNTHGARWIFRAIFPKQDTDHQANVTAWSKPVVIQ